MTATNNVGLVTGASRGLGEVIARVLAERGHDLVIGARDAAALNEARDRLAEHRTHVVAIAGDVTDASVRRRWIDAAGELGGLDVLVNNAGLICTGSPEQTPGEEWDNLVATNLTGLFNCIQAALPLMAGRAGASIVNLASVSAEKGGGAIGNVWYGTTKAGVVALTKGLGRELGPKGIRINAISPAVVDTAMTHDMLATGLGQKAIARIPLGRLAERSDVAKAALFLASEDAAFITGETIAVDGGFLRT